MRWTVYDKYPDYKISEKGDVINTVTGREVKSDYYGSSTLKVNIRDQYGRMRSTSVKRLLAEAFLGGPHKDCDIEFIDGNHFNVCASNLRWIKKTVKTLEPKIDVMRDKEVMIVETGEIFYNGWACSEETGVKVSTLRECLKDPSVSYKGKHYKLVDYGGLYFDRRTMENKIWRSA